MASERLLRFRRVLVYIVVALLVFGLAIGVGAISALMLRGDMSFSRGGEPGPQGKEDAAQREEDASLQSEANYVARVNDIQTNAVKTFLDSHEELVRYDALTANDVDKMENNQKTLGELADQADNLKPPQNPQKYREQQETFSSAISELHEAGQLGYRMASDPTAATQPRFDEYDRHVNEADANLRRSNEILGRDYRTIGGVQKVSPFS
jgi:hypothetical protein